MFFYKLFCCLCDLTLTHAHTYTHTHTLTHKDEDAPLKIPDPNAEKPAGWLDDAPEMVPDPKQKNQLTGMLILLSHYKITDSYNL